MADVDADRHARAARAPSPARAPTEAVVAELTKACRSCGSVKPLSAFARHGATQDGRRHRCRNCEPPRRPTQRDEKIAELLEANAKLTALLHEAYIGLRGGFQSVVERRHRLLLGAPEAALLREEFAAVGGVVLGQLDHGCRLNPPKALQEGTLSF
jgi:hypothetical protein